MAELFKRDMSQKELNGRKRAQSHISMATGTLGLLAAGATVASHKKVNPKLISGLSRAGVKNVKPFTRDRIRENVEPLLATSAGLGGVGAYNFAAYTKAESQKKKRMVMSKSAPSPFEDAFNGEIGFAKYYDPEDQRSKRNRSYEDASLAAAGGGTAVGAHQAWRTGESAQKMKPKMVAEQHQFTTKAGEARTFYNTKKPYKAIPLNGPAFSAAKKHGKAALIAGTVGASGIYANKKLREKRKGSWASYQKSATSAFGVVHD